MSTADPSRKGWKPPGLRAHAKYFNRLPRDIKGCVLWYVRHRLMLLPLQGKIPREVRSLAIRMEIYEFAEQCKLFDRKTCSWSAEPLHTSRNQRVAVLVVVLLHRENSSEITAVRYGLCNDCAVRTRSSTLSRSIARWQAPEAYEWALTK